MSIKLTGITWDHTRGYAPMPVTAEAYRKEHPDVEIVWEKRTLHDFGAFDVEQLAQRFDMVILDHPWAGFMSARKCYIPLEQYISKEAMAELAKHSVGPSHRSYQWDGHQWAFAIDAATQIAGYRPDLLAKLGEPVPKTWKDVLRLARKARDAKMAVAIPFGAVDAISSFLTLADNLKGEPFGGDPTDPAAALRRGARVVSDEVGKAVMSALRELLVLCDPASYDLTPVTLMERMSTTDTLVYCPHEYGYNNYGRPGYRKHLCKFANIPALGDDGPRGSHIGGTGIAVSTRCKHPQVAADYALKCSSGPWQKTIYFDFGGQPGHAAAWDDDRVNAASNNFFRDTRETIERCYLRPRYDGYIKFQYPAGAMIRECVRDNGDVPSLLKKLDQLYQETLRG